MSTRHQIDAEAQKDPNVLEREIDQQRAEIGNIVQALENKLSPGELIDTALSYVKGGGGEFFHNLSDTVKANPVPTVLTAVGMVWLMAGQNRQPHHSSASYAGGASAGGSGPSMGDKLSAKGASLKEQGASLKEKAGQLGHDVSDSLGHARERVSDSSRHASQSLRHQADRARGGFEHLLHEQPLALGAIGIALGALLGASMPSTRREDEMLGKASDQVTDQLRHKAEEGYEKATSLGEDMARQMKSEIKGSSSTDIGTGSSTGTGNRPATGSPQG